MGVRKVGGSFYYEFMINAKRFYGKCKQCSTAEEAREFEAVLKKKVREMRTITNEQALLIQYRRELTGAKDISLDEAFERAMQKPTFSPIRTEHVKKVKQKIWLDFVAFVKEKFPQIRYINEITGEHAEAYAGYLQSNGRFLQDIYMQKRSGKLVKYQRKPGDNKISASNFNRRMDECNWVFRKLQKDLGGQQSPFSTSSIQRMKIGESHRRAFTVEELKTIFDNLEKAPFVKPLIIVSFYTALRRGDICNLKWREINLADGVICRTMSKTQKSVEIPILPPLMNFLIEQQQKTGGGEYVFPEYQKLYKNSYGSSISRRVKNFLDKLGIENTCQMDGVKHRVSTKDMHSFRHSFCTIAEAAGVPGNVVQSIVGHSTYRQTLHYSRHVSLTSKREKMLSIPEMSAIDTFAHPPKKWDVLDAEIINDDDQIRQELKNLVDSMSMAEVREILFKVRKQK